MFRTRDYALMLSIITLLIVGIATTALTQGRIGGMSAAVFDATPAPESYEVVVAQKTEPSREDRIAQLRKKIANLSFTAEAEPAPTPEESPLQEVSEEEVVKAGEDRCGNYHSSLVSWNPSGLIIEEVEGARLVYREIPGVPLASSTVPIVTKDIALQLPVRSLPSASPSCISTDVIGIAKGGSLIRNTESSLYQVFGADTLIGYALDGFPIYGVANSKTDICGGTMVAGQYRYQLGDERETIINCFAGTPVAI